MEWLGALGYAFNIVLLRCLIRDDCVKCRHRLSAQALGGSIDACGNSRAEADRDVGSSSCSFARGMDARQSQPPGKATCQLNDICCVVVCA